MTQVVVILHHDVITSRTRTYLVHIVNIMAADDLATQEAWASATMILTKLTRDNSVPTR